MERKELLTRLSFGTQVAEDERKELARYFVETDQWRRISNDKIDVIRGEKGSGKSAIYALLLEKESEFFDKGILITAGENPRGETVFRDLVTEPPATEAEFILLWKLYIVSLIAREMRTYNIKACAPARPGSPVPFAIAQSPSAVSCLLFQSTTRPQAAVLP